MTTAVEMIEAHWPEHAEHTDKFGPPTMDQSAGILCGCGEVLGWPVEEPPEEDEPEPAPLALDRPKSARGREAFDKAAAAVAAARAKATPRKDDYAAEGAKTGAYGTYERKEETVTEPEIVDAVVVEDAPVRAADGPVADEAQTYAEGDSVTVGGIEFTKHSEMPFPDEPALGLTEEELAVNLGSVPDGEARGEDLGVCKAGEYEGHDECPELAVTLDPDRFCRTHWFVGTRECDAMVPDGHESMDQCQGRTAFRSDDFLCDQHGDYSGMGVSGQYYESGKVVPLEPDESKAIAVTGPEPGSGTPILPTDPDSLDPVMGLLPPLDPTQVYTPKDVEIGILEILRKLQNGELFLREQLARLHVAEHAHIMRYNLKIKTSNARAADQRKADAILACERERYEQAEAEMLVRAIRDTLHSLRSQLMGLQTVARSLGVSIGGPSYGP